LHRPRILILIGGLAAAVALGPAFGATARAADPTVVVRPGDTLTAISKRVGVPIRRLVELNRIANPNRIYAGQRLRTAVEVSAPEAPPAASAARVHVVTRGASLWAIAKHYGVSVSAIVAANGIADPSRIFAGQRLTIPGAIPPAPEAPAAAAARVHVVTRGASLWAIAKHYGVSVSAIVAANGIADPSRIFAGQRLTIPGAGAPAQATPSAPAMPASMARLVAQRDPVRDIIISEADRWGVPRAFALAVAWQESGWQQGVTSHAGAVGVMQLMPATGEWVAQSMLGGRVDIHDSRSNVRAGVRLLKHYLERYGGNKDLVLAAYYQGQAAVDRHGIYSVSRPYIASIKQLERLFGG
jgi:LysM repeat protein